jgi:hypothetical protein
MGYGLNHLALVVFFRERARLTGYLFKETENNRRTEQDIDPDIEIRFIEDGKHDRDAALVIIVRYFRGHGMRCSREVTGRYGYTGIQ